MANALVDTNHPVPTYGDIYAILATEPVPPHTPESFTHMDYYIDGFISAVQGGGLSENIYYLTAPSVLSNGYSPLHRGESKDSVSVKKLLAGDRDWACTKGVLR